MANSLKIMLSCANLSALAGSLKFINRPNSAKQFVRTLYSQETLGLTGYITSRQHIENEMGGKADSFKEKMKKYSQEDSKDMIFTEDLKNMVHLAKSNEDVQLVIRMMKKFNQQNKQLRFGTYVFGPVVMRLFHLLNKSDTALEVFKAPELNGFFDQLMTYQILLDLLYENNKYQEILDVFEDIKNRQVEGGRYPRNVVVLVHAACYKLNTKESMEYALKLWNELVDIGHQPMRRGITFCAGLAINQGNAEAALEILSASKNQSYVTVRGLKVLGLVKIGRLEDALTILKSVIKEDVPETEVQTFNIDVIESVKEAVSKCDNPDITLEFNRIEQLFQKQGHIANTTLDEQICSEIQTPPTIRPRTNFVPRNKYPQRPRPFNSSYMYSQRPGLKDIV